MKKLVKVVLVLVILLVVAVAGVLWYANRYIQSPEFKQYALNLAKESLGAEVKVNELQASLFSGVTLQGITVANPPGFDGNLLTAEALVVRYELMPLLRKRVEVSTLTLAKPEIRLVSNAQGEWNYDKLGSPTPATSTPSATTPPKTGSVETAPAIDVSLPKLELTDARILMIDENGKELVAINDVDLASSVLFRQGKLSGTGKSALAKLAVAKSLYVTDITAPVNFLGDRVRLAPLTGKLAEGAVSGELAVQLLGGSQYMVDLQVKDADMAKLLQEAGTKAVMTGKLQVRTGLTGTGGLPTINGKGQAEVTGGKLIGIPLLEMLAALLQVNELRDLAFSECKLEFTLADNKMETPVIRLVAPQLQITGTGTVALADYSLNHDMTLALAPELLNKLPKEVRALFAQQPNGMLGISFRVTGPYDAPKTDLKDKLLKGAGQQLLEKGLQKLFK